MLLFLTNSTTVTCILHLLYFIHIYLFLLYFRSNILVSEVKNDVPPVIMDVDTGSVVALAAPPAALQVDAPVSEASAVVEEMMDASIVPPPPSTTSCLNSTVDTPVLVASTVDSDVIAASVASSVESQTTMTDGLVVEISKFKELLSYGEDFACCRHVSIVKRQSATSVCKRADRVPMYLSHPCRHPRVALSLCPLSLLSLLLLRFPHLCPFLVQHLPVHLER